MEENRLLGAIDMNRPKINNGDGTFSTERTITIEADGRFYNIPTIVKGVQVEPQAAIHMWRAGENPHVGQFNSLEQALSIAKERSGMIGRVRGNEPLGYP
jgi:hypothetical protein